MKSNILASLKIQTKTWLIMLAILPVCIIVNLFVLRSVLLTRFIDLEEANIQDNLERVIKAVSQELEHLNKLNIDWAHWDDTYEFMLTKDPDYITSNLTEDTVSGLSLNFIYYIDPKGAIVWGQTIDLKTNLEMSIDEFSKGRFTADNPLTGRTTPTNGTKGIIHTSGGPALVSTVPILDSNATGDRRGWIIMGSLLNEDAIEKLGKLTNLSLSIPSDVPFDPPKDRLKQLKQLTTSAFYEIREPAVVHGYAFIKGIGKTPGVVLQVKMSREIFQKGVISIRYMAVLISITMVLVFFVLSILLQRFIVSPITKLTHHILELERTRDLELRLPQKEEECRDEACILAARVNKLLDTIEEMHKKLVDDARIDPLTLVANRRSYEEHLAMEWQRLMRTGGRLSIIMCDIDHFKLYNDRYGHQKGDDCLMIVAGLIRRIPRRPYDLVARYGGEEFVLVLPETNLEDAVGLAERIRKAVLDQHITHEASPTGQWVTLSLGVASNIVIMGTHPEDLVKQADDALYRAKKQGRNQVTSV
jgi:diguanylate cyclase (GGDEF)-like protein